MSERDQTDRATSSQDALSLKRQIGAINWNLILVWFLRLMAVVWIIKGLVAWADILGVIGAKVPFEARSHSAQALLIYFAVIDLVAAVGLWLTSTWGGVMWLLALMSNLILAVFAPGVIASGTFTIIFFILLIAAYLTISWFAAHEEA